MNKNLQNIDKIFFQHLDTYNETPPEDAWNTIENELNKKEAALYKGKYLWLKKIVICAVCIAAFLLAGNVLQPVLNKHVYKNAGNVNKQRLIDSSAKKKNSALNRLPAYLLPEKILHSKTETPKTIVKPTYKNDSNGYLKTPQLITDGTSSVISAQLNPVYTQKENFVQAKPKDVELATDVIKHDQPTVNTANKSTVRIKQKRFFYIVPYFSIDHVSGRIKTLSQTGNSNLPPFDKERLDMAWTGGILIEKEISQKVSLQTGLMHSFWSNQISPAVVKALQDNSGVYKFKLTTDYGYAELKKSDNAHSGDSAIVTNGVVKLHSFFVPVTAAINLKKGRLKINAVTGGSINFITGDIAEIEYRLANNLEKDDVQKLQGLRKSYIAAIGGAEIHYSIKQNISFGINPVVRYAITPVNKSTLVKTYPVSLGVGASLRMKL